MSGTLGVPGTELGNGFSVPEGARLIGAGFPHIDGWTAYLLVDDHVVAVYDRLAEQARAAGLVGIQGSATACVAYDDVESDGTAVGDRRAAPRPLEAVPEPVLAIECSGETVREFDPSSEQHPYPGRWVGVSALQGVPRCCTTWQSWAMLTVVDTPGPQATLPGEASTARAAQIEIIPPIGAALPSFDDVIGEGLDETVLQLVDGSVLLVPEFWNGAVTGGYTAVLRVTRDADPVLRAYATQIPDTFAPRITNQTRDGWKVTTAGGEAAGGGGLYATLYEQDHQAFVTITRSDD